MTSKERLNAVFTGRCPDRVPIWMMFPFEQEPFAADVYNEPSYAEVASVVRENTDFIERNATNTDFLIGEDHGFVNIDFLFNHPNIEKHVTEGQQNGKKIIAHQVQFGDLFLEKTITFEGDRIGYENYLKDINDLQKIMELPYQVPRINMDFYREREKRLGEYGLHGIQCIDPISVFHDLCSETDFAMWVYTHTEEVRAFLELLSERIVAIYRQFLEQGIGEVFWISGPEYLCPPFASPEVFHHLGIFYDKPLFDLIRSYGKQTILHCHGLIYDVLDSIAELDPSGLHPIEPHPIGDCHLSDARKRLGEEMVLIGNIEYSNLETKAPTEIEDEVKRAIEEGGPGRFILSPSCTPFADSITPQVADNYVAMINAGLEYGKLS